MTGAGVTTEGTKVTLGGAWICPVWRVRCEDEIETYFLVLTIADLCDNRVGNHGGVGSGLAGDGVGNHAGDSAGLDSHSHVGASGSLDLSITDLLILH